MLVRHPEEVAFVVGLHIATWFHPHQSIVVAFMNSDDKTAKDQCAGLISHLTHPFCGTHVHVLSQARSSHGKTSSEHLWQYDHVGCSSDLPDFLFKHCQIGLNVLPMYIRLDEGDFQILHV